MHYTSKEVYEYISKQSRTAVGQSGDPIIERKTCKVSGTKFAIFQSDLDFYEKISPSFNPPNPPYQGGIIPTPTLCPEERQRRRLMFRNEWKLYKRKCDATGENIISIYSPDKPHKVYSQDFWWSDKWDGLEYGQEISFEENITEQLAKLRKKVPLQNVIIVDNENCDYTTGVGYSKNCYLINSSENSEDCYYGKLFQNCKSCTDCSYVYDSESLYQCLNVKKSFDCSYLYNSQECNKCHFSEDMVGCSNCMFCTSLRNKQYCFENKQLTKEEYNKKKKEYLGNFANIQNALKKFKDVRKDKISRYSNTFHCENSFGDYLSDNKNCINCFDTDSSEDCKYLNVGVQVKDIVDGNNIYLGSEKNYDVLGTMGAYNIIFSLFIFDSNNIIYSQNCHDCNNLFGCMGLRNKEYCIFNKQYSKDEYQKIIPKIINYMIETGERGEFFDPSLSPFAYNESLSQEYFPINKSEALKRGYKRQDNNYDPIVPDGIETLKGDQILGDISNVTDDILKKIFICEVSDRPFRIIKQELEFYHKHNIPLPRKHPDIRYNERLRQRPPRELHLRDCDKCGVKMLSVYKETLFSKEGGEGNEPGNSTKKRNPLTPFPVVLCGTRIKGGTKVYCEKCYNKEVYG